MSTEIGPFGYGDGTSFIFHASHVIMPLETSHATAFQTTIHSPYVSSEIVDRLRPHIGNSGAGDAPGSIGRRRER